jgi:hypothetical protein
MNTATLEEAIESEASSPVKELYSLLVEGCDPFGQPELRELVELFLSETARAFHGYLSLKGEALALDDVENLKEQYANYIIVAQAALTALHELGVQLEPSPNAE